MSKTLPVTGDHKIAIKIMLWKTVKTHLLIQYIITLTECLHKCCLLCKYSQTLNITYNTHPISVSHLCTSGTSSDFL